MMLKVIASLVITALLAAAAPALAQNDAEPLSAEELGISELSITVTDDGWDAPAELAAGRYLVTASYEGDREFGTTAFALLPDGWTIDDFNNQLETGRADDDADATPATSVSLTDPDIIWLYDLTLAGGVSPVSGSTAQGIVDLTPGNWAIWADDFSPEAIPLTVTGEEPPVQQIPESAVVVREVGDEDTFTFEIEGEITAGTQVLQIVNDSDQPHFVEFLQLSAPVTADQLDAFLATPSGLDPDPALGLPADFQVFLSPYYAATQSPGVTQWIVTGFQPGTYAMICWLPDPNNNMASHASEGMITIFEIR